MTHQEILENQFSRMGVRLKVEEGLPRSRTGETMNFSINVQQDQKGEFFQLRIRSESDLQIDVVDVQAAEEHLLLLVKDGDIKEKFLCGHDERHWFVAAVPERRGVSNVQTAMEALKPAEVQQAQDRKKVKVKDRKRRKNNAYIRQGEWFFVPAPELQVKEHLVHRNEPLRRAGGKAHIAEFCYRTGGETVYVCRQYPNGLLEAEYKKVLETNPRSQKWQWQVMRRNAQVYVKGGIRHSDHKTILLPFWHRVLMNTESESRAMQSVAFLD